METLGNELKKLRCKKKDSIVILDDGQLFNLSYDYICNSKDMEELRKRTVKKVCDRMFFLMPDTK